MLRSVVFSRLLKLGFLAIFISLFTLSTYSPAAAGTSFYLPWSDDDSWMVSQGYNGITHQANAYYGIDFWRPGIEGSPVLASADGVVVKVVNSFTQSTWPNPPNLSGNVVIIKHDDGTYTQYCHLQKENAPTNGNNGFVKVGDKVRHGARIGTVGTTGSASGPHLHFQRQNGDNENSQSIPVSFADVAGGDVSINQWYVPIKAARDTTPPVIASLLLPKPTATPPPSILPPAPPVAGSLLAPKNGELVANSSIMFQWSPSKDSSGITNYIFRVGKLPDLTQDTSNLLVNFSTDGLSNPLVTSYSTTLSDTAGTFYWTVIAKNKAGLTTAYQQGTFYLDTVPPSGSITLQNAPDSLVESQSFDLKIKASDIGTGVERMMLSEDPDFRNASWERYEERRTWEPSAGAGGKTIFAKFIDRAGNVSPVSTLEVQLHSADSDESILKLALQIAGAMMTWLM